MAYSVFLHSHSLIRYILLILLIVVMINSVIKMSGDKPFTKMDNKLSLYLLIFTHMQLVIGLILYIISPFVQFNSQTMSDKYTRYWTVEHITIMLIAIAIITFGRVKSKRIEAASGKFRVLFYTSLIALALILVGIAFSGRGLLGSL